MLPLLATPSHLGGRLVLGTFALAAFAGSVYVILRYGRRPGWRLHNQPEGPIIRGHEARLINALMVGMALWMMEQCLFMLWASITDPFHADGPEWMLGLMLGVVALFPGNIAVTQGLAAYRAWREGKAERFLTLDDEGEHVLLTGASAVEASEMTVRRTLVASMVMVLATVVFCWGAFALHGTDPEPAVTCEPQYAPLADSVD